MKNTMLRRSGREQKKNNGLLGVLHVEVASVIIMGIQLTQRV